MYNKSLQITSTPQALTMNKFSSCRKTEKEKSYIYSGDLLRLLHIDTDGCIDAKIHKNYQKKLSEII